MQDIVGNLQMCQWQGSLRDSVKYHYCEILQVQFTLNKYENKKITGVGAVWQPLITI